MNDPEKLSCNEYNRRSTSGYNPGAGSRMIHEAFCGKSPQMFADEGYEANCNLQSSIWTHRDDPHLGAAGGDYNQTNPEALAGENKILYQLLNKSMLKAAKAEEAIERILLDKLQLAEKVENLTRNLEELIKPHQKGDAAGNIINSMKTKDIKQRENEIEVLMLDNKSSRNRMDYQIKENAIQKTRKSLKECQFCGEKHWWGSQNCKAFGTICCKCKKPNHFSRVCRNKRYQRRSSTHANADGKPNTRTADVDKTGDDIPINIEAIKANVENAESTSEDIPINVEAIQEVSKYVKGDNEMELPCLNSEVEDIQELKNNDYG